MPRSWFMKDVWYSSRLLSRGINTSAIKIYVLRSERISGGTVTELSSDDKYLPRSSRRGPPVSRPSRKLNFLVESIDPNPIKQESRS